MKKLLSTVFALGMVMSLIACNKGKGNNNPNPPEPPAPQDTLVEEVEVFGAHAIEFNLRVGEALSGLDTNDERYELNTTMSGYLYTDENSAVVQALDTDRMTFEVAYTLKVVVDAKEGYYFNTTTTAKIDDVAVTGDIGVVNVQKRLVFYKEYEALDPVVHQIKVWGVSEPVVGEAAATNGITLTDVGGRCEVDLTTTATFWVDQNDYKFANGNIFQAGKMYTIRVVISPTEYNYLGENRYCSFADDITVQINGHNATNISTVGVRDLCVQYSFLAQAAED